MLLLESPPRRVGLAIAKLATKSFQEGWFPHSFKPALVTPLIKKPNLDPSNLSNNGPISNLNNVYHKYWKNFLLKQLSSLPSITSVIPPLLINPQFVSTLSWPQRSLWHYWPFYPLKSFSLNFWNLRSRSAMDHLLYTSQIAHKSLTICQTWQLFV